MEEAYNYISIMFLKCSPLAESLGPVLVLFISIFISMSSHGQEETWAEFSTLEVAACGLMLLCFYEA